LLNPSEDFLKTLFIVSNVVVTDEGSLGTSCPEWLYSDSVSMPGKLWLIQSRYNSDCESDLGIRVRPATLSKCPRCWTFTRLENEAVCGRCAAVIDL
jgi:isoleucyl-tRNA synthetase